MGACKSLGSMRSLALFAALLTAQGLQQSTLQRRRSLLRAAASDDAEALLAAAASLRAEASQLEKEIAPPVAPPPPPPPRPEVVAGVDARELVPWTGKCFAAKIELDQFDEAGDAGGVATRSTPAEWQPWFEPGASVAFRRTAMVRRREDETNSNDARVVGAAAHGRHLGGGRRRRDRRRRGRRGLRGRAGGRARRRRPPRVLRRDAGHPLRRRRGAGGRLGARAASRGTFREIFRVERFSASRDFPRLESSSGGPTAREKSATRGRHPSSGGRSCPATCSPSTTSWTASGRTWTRPSATRRSSSSSSAALSRFAKLSRRAGVGRASPRTRRDGVSPAQALARARP